MYLYSLTFWILQTSEEKCKTLTDAGFEFEVSKERKSEAMKYMDKSWDEFYAELEQYKAKYGQINSIKQRRKRHFVNGVMNNAYSTPE
jgi:hypothetical protein